MQVNASMKANACQIVYNNVQLGKTVSSTDLLLCAPPQYTNVQFYLVGAILLVLTLTTTGGNLLITLAILLVKRLRSPANLLILNLAVTDLLISLIVLPLALVYQLKGYWPLNRYMCDFYIIFDVLLCTTSILSLCAISIDRYFSITRPFTYAAKRTTGRILVMILLCWLAAALISIPPVFIWEKEQTPLHCSYSEDLTYQVYATVIAFYLPLIVMLAIYSRIYLIVRRLVKENSFAKGKTAKTVRQDNLDSCKMETANHASYEHQEQLFKHHPASDSVQPTSRYPAISLSKRQLRAHKSQSSNPSHLCRIRRSKVKDGGRDWPTKSHDGGGSDICIPECMSRKMSNVSSESVKAVITLGVIMGTFILCWLPFFFCQLIIPIINTFDRSIANFIPLTLLQVFLWLGYMNSLLNPIIYAKFNRDFRLPFLLILKCQCRHINQHVRRRSFTTQFEIPKSHLATCQDDAARKLQLHRQRRQRQSERVKLISFSAMTHESPGAGHVAAKREEVEGPPG